jgi:hypothetical protein
MQRVVVDVGQRRARLGARIPVVIDEGSLRVDETINSL